MTEPTDAELIAELEAAGVSFLAFLGGLSGAKKVWTTSGSQDAKKIAAGMRAAIAKWGTPPAVAGEVASLVQAAQAFVLDPTSLQKKLHLEAQAWGPLATTPHPTQAQAGAVPLPKSYHGSTLTSNSHDAGCRVSFSFSSVAEAEAWHESIVDQRHGIKGGQRD